jgi:cyanophycin synthetase
MGLGKEAIDSGLRSFQANFDTNPGRLNVYQGHPFTVIMDYAHNPDGMEQLLDCVDRMEVAGRRILLYAATGNRSDAEAVRHARLPVGRVDHFVVRRYPGKLRGRRPDEIPALMRAALLEAGVPEERITIADPPEQGAVIAMRLARPGDLVIMAPGTVEFQTMWEQILSFGADTGPAY